MAEANSTITFKEVSGFPGYRVGDDGSVWNCWKHGYKTRHQTDQWKQMKTPPGSKGYLRVNLVPPEGGRKYTTFRVHRLVLMVFVGPCPDGMECRHLNGIKTDNRLSNLAWGTPDQNYEDIRRHGSYSNKPRNRMYTYQGQTLSLTEWARHLGVSYACLHQRIRTLKMSFEDAIAAPFLGVAGNKPGRRLNRTVG